MVAARSKDPRYKSYGDILRWHGLFVALGYFLLQASEFTPSRIWFKLPKKICFLKRLAWNEKFQKATPWWHDIGVILLVVVTYLVILSEWNNQYWLSVVARAAAGVLLVDILAYHVRVLWFDDLEIRKTIEHRKVWSHRRILFQAIINFFQSLCLFAVVYHAYQPTAPFRTLLQASFTVATTLTRPASLNVPAILFDLQVAVSIFFLVVVVSVVASIGYNRPELGNSFRD